MCACALRATPASAETEAEYLGESVSNFDMTTFARSRYRDFAESRGSDSTAICARYPRVFYPQEVNRTMQADRVQC